MRIEEMLSRAEKWLLEQQDQQSGGWPPYYGGALSTLNTAEAIVALLDIDYQKYSNDPQVLKGVEFLEKSRCSEGQSKGAWLRSVPRADEEFPPVPDIIRTSFAVQALIRTSRGRSSAVQEGLDWIIRVRKAEAGGWGYKKDASIFIMPTCFALLALINATKTEVRDCTEIIESGIRCLINFRRKSGSFCTLQDRQNHLEAIHTVYVILTLQAVRISGIRTYPKEEEGGLRWLVDHSEAALRIVEDRIAIDGSAGRANYDYLYLANTFVAQVMLNAEQKEFNSPEKNKLLHNALDGLMSTWSVELGGFYSPRLVTWATAKAVTPLKIGKSKNVIDSLPISCVDCKPYREVGKKDPRETGRDIAIFLSVIVAVVFALTVAGLYTWLTASSLIVITVIALVGYDKITDNTLGKTLKLFFQTFLQ